MCLAAKHLKLLFCERFVTRGRVGAPRAALASRRGGAPGSGRGSGRGLCPPLSAPAAAALRRCLCHGGLRRGAGRDGALPLPAGVALRQRRDGLQLQREEKVWHLAPPLALPRPGREGNGGAGAEGTASRGGGSVVPGRLHVSVPLKGCGG